MCLSLAPLLARDIEVLPATLRALASELGPDFTVVADCGAGIGMVSRKYRDILRSSLPAQHADRVRVYSYEPLPENLAAMAATFAGDDAFVVRPVAVSDKAGEATFSVPGRLQDEWAQWPAGSSYNGFISETNNGYEQLTVETVRLEDEEPSRFDFVKLDLQGGEHRAIIGLGEKLAKTKLLYVEHQLLGAEDSIALLRDQGFVIRFDRVAFGIDKATSSSRLSRLWGRVTRSDGDGSQLSASTLRKLGEAGIIVASSEFIPGAGVVGHGHLTPLPGILDEETLSLSAKVSKRLRKLGVHYLQTDVLAIHPSVAPHVFAALERL